MAKKKRKWVPRRVYTALKERQKYLCIYCQRFSRDFELDHLIPVSRGGDDSLENLVIACSLCNTQKGPLTPLEFIFKVPKSLVFARG